MTKRRRPSLPTLALCVALLTGIGLAGPAAAGPKLSAEQLKKLHKGDVIRSSHKVSGSDVTEGEAIALIKDVPEAVLYVLSRVEKYKHFLPRVTESRVTKRTGWHTYAVVHTDLPWPVKDCWVYIKLTRKDNPGRVYELSWRMLNGTLKNYRGSARMEPLDKKGQKTLLTYRLFAVPKTSAPDSMISKGVKSIASTIVKRARLRLKALRKYKKLPKGM